MQSQLSPVHRFMIKPAVLFRWVVWKYRALDAYPVARCYICEVVCPFDSVGAALSVFETIALIAMCIWIVTACVKISIQLLYCIFYFL